jgi:hypothetical protein
MPDTAPQAARPAPDGTVRTRTAVLRAVGTPMAVEDIAVGPCGRATCSCASAPQASATPTSR